MDPFMKSVQRSRWNMGALDEDKRTHNDNLLARWCCHRRVKGSGGGSMLSVSSTYCVVQVNLKSIYIQSDPVKYIACTSRVIGLRF